MSAPSVSRLSGRLVSPSTLLLALLLMPLPWFEIRCNEKDEAMLTQSGLQAVWGGYSEGQWVKDERKKTEERWVGTTDVVGGKVAGKEVQEIEGRHFSIAPLMGVYLAALVIGILAGLTLSRWRERLLAVSACCAIAFCTFAVQLIIGFPAAKEIFPVASPDERIDWPAGRPTKKDLAELADIGIKVRHTPWLYTAFLLTGFSVASVALELFSYGRAALRMPANQQHRLR
jgi:hypothetical protein